MNHAEIRVYFSVKKKGIPQFRGETAGLALFYVFLKTTNLGDYSHLVLFKMGILGQNCNRYQLYV